MRRARFLRMTGRVLVTVLFVFLAVVAPVAMIAIRFSPQRGVAGAALTRGRRH